VSLKDEAVRKVYAIKQRAWREKLRRYREFARDPLVSARVLVRMDAGIGNAVEATPLVQAIRAMWPRTHLTILPPSGDLFDDWCVVDRVARSLEGEAFDATFVPWCVEKPGDAPSFDPGEVHAAQGPFPHWQLRPEREVNMDAVRRLGFEGPTPPLYVSVKEPADKPPEAKRRIAIAPGGKADHRWRHKRWPYYRELIERLRGDAQICVVGTPGDAIDLPGGALDLRGRHTLRETAWVLRESDLVIGNDCGPTHVADAVLSPVLVLFGPSCEIKNGPRNRGRTLESGAPCSPCQYDLELLDTCDDAICMRNLTVDAVVEAAGGLLSGN